MLVFNTSNTYKIGFDNLYYYSEVYRELCIREDFHTILLNNYLNIRHQDVFVEEISKRIYRLEILLSNEEILNKFSEEEIEILYQELEVKKEDRLELDVIYHYDTNVFYESVEEQGLISTYSNVQVFTGYTPHGNMITLTSVGSIDLSPDMFANEKQRVSSQHPNAIELVAPMSGFECSRYAFYSQSIDNPFTFIGDENLPQYIDASLYKKVFDSQLSDYIPKPGDIIGYSVNGYVETNDMFGMDHFAIVESNPNNISLTHDNRNSIIVTSKWGHIGGIYRHALNDYEKSNNSSTPNSTFEYKYYCFRLLVDNNIEISNSNQNITNNFNLSTRNSSLSDSFRLIKLQVERAGIYSFDFNSNYPLNVRLYDYSLGEINYELTTFKSYGSEINYYYSYLQVGTYYLYVEYANTNNSGNVSYSINYESGFIDGRMITDPGFDWLCGTQITLYDYLYAPDFTYNSNVIVEGFTRVIYFDNSLVNDLSRLDYTFFSSDRSLADVTDYGTVIAKSTNITKQVTIYAVNKDNPNSRYSKVFTIVPYSINEVMTINLAESINTSQSKYIDLDMPVPFELLQSYRWESLNKNICTVNYLGKITGVSTGTVQIRGVYKNNPDIILVVTVDVN